MARRKFTTGGRARSPRSTHHSGLVSGLSGLCARLARARFGGEPSSGSLARRKVDCEWRMGGSSPPLRGQVLARSLAHGCVATSEGITAAMRMYLFCGMKRHALRMPSVGWLLGALPNDGAGNSPTPFTAQEFTLPLALRLGSAAGTPLWPTPTRRAWAACSGDALVGSPPRARTAPHVFLGARCQQRCGTSHGTGNARTHLGWRSGKRRGAIILAPTAARRAGKLGALRGTALRA